MDINLYINKWLSRIFMCDFVWKNVVAVDPERSGFAACGYVMKLRSKFLSG